MANSLEHCLAYLEKLPAAISGSGGHKATYEAALACRRFGLSGGQMWQALTWFNDNRCSLPWSERELRHKLASVTDIQVNKPLGHGGAQSVKPVTGDELKKLSGKRTRPAPELPACRQSEEAEEAWWRRVLAERGIEDPATAYVSPRRE